MMIELKSSEKRKAKALLAEESPTFAHAIAEGIIEGNVYVDDFLTPATALFRTSSGIYYVAGNPPDSGRSEWLHYLNEQRSGARFTVFSASEEWDAFLIGGLAILCGKWSACHFSSEKRSVIAARHLPG